jgi:NAD(P)-dependent dehydrogenase (short-subunit alcohol dehydrogenase family)
MGEPSEIAELAVFLASEHGKYLSGEVINVDGGARYRY